MLIYGYKTVKGEDVSFFAQNCGLREQRLTCLCSNYVEEASSEMSCSKASSLIISRLENTSCVPNILESWKLYGKLACVCIVHFLNTEFITLVQFSSRFIHSVSIYWEPTMCQVYRKEWDKDHTVWELAVHSGRAADKLNKYHLRNAFIVLWTWKGEFLITGGSFTCRKGRNIMLVRGKAHQRHGAIIYWFPAISDPI